LLRRYIKQLKTARSNPAMHTHRSTACVSRISLILLSAGMAACGGGGGGGIAAVPADLVSIDAGNAETITREVLSASFGSSDLGTVAGGDILGADGGPSALAVHLAGRRTIQAAGQAVSQAAGQVQPSANYGPEREDCLVSGTITLSASLASTDTLGRGDQITAVFANCNDGDGAVYNGRLRIDVQGFTGDLFADRYQLDSRFTMTNLAITEDGLTETGNGTLNVNMNLLTAGLESYAISATRFELASGNTSWVFHDLVSSIDDDYRSGTWLTTVSESGSLESSSFGGRVDYGTTTPFQSVDGSYPRVGVVRIDGANGTSVVVTALDEEDLQLAIDWTGDTVVDETRLMEWNTVPGW
jgi:hypothetical protein